LTSTCFKFLIWRCELYIRKPDYRLLQI